MSVPFKKTDHLPKFVFGAALLLSGAYVALDLLLSALEALITLLHRFNFTTFN